MNKDNKPTTKTDFIIASVKALARAIYNTDTIQLDTMQYTDLLDRFCLELNILMNGDNE